MCFDICTINIRVSIRVRGFHLVFFHLVSRGVFGFNIERIWLILINFNQYRETLKNTQIVYQATLAFVWCNFDPYIPLLCCSVWSPDLNQLDETQRRMIRPLIGGVRLQDERSKGTMIRMNKRARPALHCRSVRSWKHRFAHQPFAFATEVAGSSRWLKPEIMQCLFHNWQDNFPQQPVRSKGRPPKK